MDLNARQRKEQFQPPQRRSQGRMGYLAEGQRRSPNPRTNIPLWLQSPTALGANFSFNIAVNHTHTLLALIYSSIRWKECHQSQSSHKN